MAHAVADHPGTDAGTPFGVDIDLVTGAMAAPDRVLVRLASDMKGYYKDAAALDRLIAAGSHAPNATAIPRSRPLGGSKRRAWTARPLLQIAPLAGHRHTRDIRA